MSAVEASSRETQIVVQCMVCGESFTEAQTLASCPSCGGLLDVTLSLPSRISAEEIGAGIPEAGRHSGVWRYHQLLPSLPSDAIVSRWEGTTPLYRDERLDRYAGL